MPIKVQFVCDGNRDVGYGHISRCINIANAMMALVKYPSYQQELTVDFHGDYDAVAVKMMSAVDSNNHQAETSPTARLCIIDSYSLTPEEHKHYSQNSDAIACIDDFADYQHLVFDRVVNFRLSAPTLFENPSEKHCLGLSFFPIHPAMKERREQRMLPDSRHQYTADVLVYLGGSAPPALIANVIAALDKRLADKNIVLVASLGDYQMTRNRLNHIRYSQDLHQVLASVGALICGGGLIKYEAGYCLVPNASISLNEGQDEDSQQLAAANLTYNLGLVSDNTVPKLDEKLSNFFSSHEFNLQHNASLHAFDSNSCFHLARTLLSSVDPKFQRLIEEERK